MPPAKTPSTRRLPRCAGIGLFMGGRRSSASNAPDALKGRAAGVLEHDSGKWIPVFGKRSCSNKRLKRNDDSNLKSLRFGRHWRLSHVVEAGRPAVGSAHGPAHRSWTRPVARSRAGNGAGGGGRRAIARAGRGKDVG